MDMMEFSKEQNDSLVAKDIDKFLSEIEAKLLRRYPDELNNYQNLSERIGDIYVYALKIGLSKDSTIESFIELCTLGDLDKHKMIQDYFDTASDPEEAYMDLLRTAEYMKQRSEQ